MKLELGMELGASPEAGAWSTLSTALENLGNHSGTAIDVLSSRRSGPQGEYD